MERIKKPIFGKTIYIKNEYGEDELKQINLFKHLWNLIIKFFKNKTVNNILKWLGDRITKLIDNIINIIGSGIIAASILKIIN